ncbi:MAG: imidazole glycerol phosphate synthase subunit HisH [Candidatus Micrarchaeia archaeon]
MPPTIALVDYGAGNLLSIANAVKRVGGKARLARGASGLGKCDALILPGVGSFALVKRLAGMRGELLKQVESGKPYLGICLGMQVLFEQSEEARGMGFAVFEGRVERLPRGVKMPHIGWNQVEKTGSCALFKGIPDNSFFYFDHSYYAKPKDKSIVVGRTGYGVRFASAIACKNVFGVQFHPERSGVVGLRVMKNFIELAR